MSTNPAIGVAALCLLAAFCLGGGALAAGAPELKAAREELRLRVETERRMRRDYEALLAGGRMSAAEVADFEEYLRELGLLVDEQRRAVARLQGRGAQSADATPGALPADFDRGQTDAEKLALLDAQLGSSLSEFDEELLREQREIAEKSRSASSADSGGEPGTGEGASAKSGEKQGEKGAGEAGKDASSASTGEAGEAGEAGKQSNSGERPEKSGGTAEGNDQVASAGGTSDASRRPGNTSVPPDIPDGKDDDIVARQLREAAESEQDPELREKLWEEYRKYKNRTR
jgi:hypothetical protein